LLVFDLSYKYNTCLNAGHLLEVLQCYSDFDRCVNSLLYLQGIKGTNKLQEYYA